MTRIAVIYYSVTGNVHALAQAVADGAAAEGAEEVFLDLSGELWERGALVDKVATSFTSSQTEHGGRESTILALNNRSYHWAAIVLPLGYTVREVFNGGGNPYGASYTSDHRIDGRPGEEASIVARGQGARLTRVATAIAAAQTAAPLAGEASAETNSSNRKG